MQQRRYFKPKKCCRTCKKEDVNKNVKSCIFNPWATRDKLVTNYILDGYSKECITCCIIIVQGYLWNQCKAYREKCNCFKRNEIWYNNKLKSCLKVVDTVLHFCRILFRLVWYLQCNVMCNALKIEVCTKAVSFLEEV